ncbi:MAG: tripartite tricarboxylate transporter substrate-binding protein, partial [Rhodoferax sp.]
MRSTLPRRRALLSLAALSTTMLAPLVSRAQQAWPSRGLRVIVPFPPGGATDTSARIVAEQLALRLRQPVVVENKPGAATVIGMEAAAKAAPDGYTLLVTGGGSLSVLPALRNNLPYDVARDFAPITQLVSAPVVIITPAGRPFQKLADVIAAAKARPNGIRYATYGTGSAPHLAGELLAST